MTYRRHIITIAEKPFVYQLRPLDDVYDITQIMDDLTLVCLFVDSELLGFEEATHDKCWKRTMDKEIKAIQKNNTWELSTLPKGHKAT